MTTSRQLLERLRASSRADDGIAMLTVIATAFVLSIFVVVLTARTMMVTSTARTDRQREQAIQIADGGAQIMIRKALAGATYNVTLPTDHATAFTSTYPSCERTWVLWAVNATANGTAPTPTCPTATSWTVPTSTCPITSCTTNDGSFKVLYAQDVGTNGVVYSVGVGAGTTQHQRIVREEVVIKSTSTLMLTNAVLTNTDLTMTGGGAITGSGGNVHTNGVIDCCGGGTVSGTITGSSCASGCSSAQSKSCLPAGQVTPCNPTTDSGGGKPVQSVPSFAASDYWNAADYVLCPDGVIHLGPHYSGPLGTAPSADRTVVTPCSSADPTIASTLNWSYGSPTWSYASGSPSTNGVYFAYHANVKVSGGGQFNGSIFAEGAGTGCTLTGGSVTLTPGGAFYPDTANTASGGFAVLADGPIKMSSGGASFSGIFYTNQTFNLTGGGSMTNVAVISNDTHSPSCGSNVDTMGGGISNDGSLSLTTNASPSASSLSWLEL